MDISLSQEQISKMASKLEDASFEFIDREAKEIVWGETWEKNILEKIENKIDRL